jgi:hypothetical protein
VVIDSDFYGRVDGEMAVIRHEVHYLTSGDEIAIGGWLAPYDKKCRAQGRIAGALIEHCLGALQITYAQAWVRGDQLCCLSNLFLNIVFCCQWRVQ